MADGDTEAEADQPERRLREARRRLASLAGGAPDSHPRLPGDDAAQSGSGEALDGRIRAVAARARLTALELDARVMRVPPEELGGHVAAAVNAAFDDLRGRAGTGAQAPVVDPAALLDGLRQVQEQGLRQMTVIGQGLDEAMARIQAGIRRAEER